MEKKRPNTLLRRARKLQGWSQSKVAEAIGAATEDVSRWECGTKETSLYYQAKLCTLFNLNAVELGFIDGIEASIPPDLFRAIERIVVSLLAQKQDLQRVLQLIIPTVTEILATLLEGVDASMLRRTLLQLLFETSGIAVAPLPLPLVVQNETFLVPDEYLATTKQNILSCWALYRQGGGSIAEQYIPVCVQQLDMALSRTQDHHKEIASLASQACQLQWLLEQQKLNFGSARNAARQAFKYAEIAEDPDLMIASLTREARLFRHIQDPMRQSRLQEQALRYVSGSSPSVSGWLYLTMAEAHAHLGDAYEVEDCLEIARKNLAIPTDPNASYIHVDTAMFAVYELESYLHLQRPEDALKAMERYQGNPTLINTSQVELTNRQLQMFLQLNDLPQACTIFKAALPKVISSNSQLRYSELCNLYFAMQEKWPHEQEIKQLEGLLN